MNKFKDKAKIMLICLDCDKKFEAIVGPEEIDPKCPDCDSEYIDLFEKGKRRSDG